MAIPEERRVVPRHLRDSEHDAVANTSVAGRRAEDVVPGRVRWILWLALVAAAAASAWWLLD